MKYIDTLSRGEALQLLKKLTEEHPTTPLEELLIVVSNVKEVTDIEDYFKE